MILVVRLRDGHILEANPAAERAYGYAREELLGLNLPALRAPGPHEQSFAQMKQAGTAGFLFETLHRRKDGSIFPVEVHTVESVYAGERVNLNMIRDITGRILVEQSARESERSHREELRSSNTMLGEAYDETIEGWSRALDLRDHETEGHSRRVTELSIQMGQAVGVGAKELAHIRRGALLHDIGKVGVPDHILLKPEGLSSEEWEIMKRHPQYAYDLLSPIAFLEPALDIPYCHHEKWDGGGYPNGLTGEQIPQPARIFAIVDVWDALCSDRPYRKAWSVERTKEYIRQQAGKHFDPKIVQIFLDLIASKGI